MNQPEQAASQYQDAQNSARCGSSEESISICIQRLQIQHWPCHHLVATVVVMS